MQTVTQTPAGEASASVTRPYAAQILPHSLVELAGQIEAIFLGDDYAATAEWAVNTGAAVFICGAHATLKERQKIAADYLADAIGAEFRKNSQARQWLDSLPAAERAEVLAARVDLRKVDGAIADYNERQQRRLQDLRTASKDQLRRVIAETLLDVDGEDSDQQVLPAALVICANGALGVFRHRGSAMEFARASKSRFLFVEIARESLRIQAADDDALLSAAAAAVASKSP